jgi:hypothetical protein
MTKEKVKKLIDRCKNGVLENYIEDANEYDFDSYAILVSVIDDDWEYGYGDYSYRYETLDDFFKNAEKDILKEEYLDEVTSVSIDIVYYDKDDPYDEERIEYEEIF